VQKRPPCTALPHAGQDQATASIGSTRASNGFGKSIVNETCRLVKLKAPPCSDHHVWVPFRLMCFLVVGLTGLFASYSSAIPLVISSL